jgi:hypothetical protein
MQQIVPEECLSKQQWLLKIYVEMQKAPALTGAF